MKSLQKEPLEERFSNGVTVGYLNFCFNNWKLRIPMREMCSYWLQFLLPPPFTVMKESKTVCQLPR